MNGALTIPIAIVLGLMIQTTAAGYFAGKIAQILKNHERRLTKLEPTD